MFLALKSMQMITFPSKSINENNGTILSTTYQRGDARQGSKGGWSTGGQK